MTQIDIEKIWDKLSAKKKKEAKEAIHAETDLSVLQSFVDGSGIVEKSIEKPYVLYNAPGFSVTSEILLKNMEYKLKGETPPKLIRRKQKSNVITVPTEQREGGLTEQSEGSPTEQASETSGGPTEQREGGPSPTENIVPKIEETIDKKMVSKPKQEVFVPKIDAPKKVNIKTVQKKVKSSPPTMDELWQCFDQEMEQRTDVPSRPLRKVLPKQAGLIIEKTIKYVYVLPPKNPKKILWGDMVE